MSSDLFFENKKYISAKDAAHLTSYTSDYVGQLCRANKVESKKIGRTWYVSEESILDHKNLGVEFSSTLIDTSTDVKSVKNTSLKISSLPSFSTLISKIKIPNTSDYVQKAHKKVFSSNFYFGKKLTTASLIVILLLGTLSIRDSILGLTLSASRLADTLPK